jgi:hypothetical protein
MEEKEFKAWLEEQRRSMDLRLDVDGRWWHNEQPFKHAGLVKAFNSGIDRHPDTREPIIRIGSTWCYFASAGSPFIVRRLVHDRNVLQGLRLNTEVEVNADAVTFYTKSNQVFAHHETYDEIRFDRTSQAALAPFLSSDGTHLHLATSAGPARIRT